MNIKIMILPIIASAMLFAHENKDKKHGVAPATDSTYQKECASCHFGFQAGLLPKRSWEKMMDNLEDHFQSDASLDANTTAYLKDYLIRNSADSTQQYKKSKKLVRSIDSTDTPLRITQLKYFKKEHREIPKRMITQEEVGSLSNCMACHTNADKGSYSERGIVIPNYGKWED